MELQQIMYLQISNEIWKKTYKKEIDFFFFDKSRSGGDFQRSYPSWA